MTFRPLPVLLIGLFLVLLVLPDRSSATEPEEEQRSFAAPYRQALRIDPDNLTLHYLLGLSLLSDNRPEEALEEFRHAFPAFIDSIEMNYHFGRASLLSGDLDSASLYLDRAESLGAATRSRLYPLADTYYHLGLAYLEADDPEEAIRALRRSLALDPDRSAIHRLLGDLYAQQGDADRALRAFGAFMERYPRDRGAREDVYTLHFNRALQHLERQEFEEARDAFGRALSASPGSPLALYHLGLVDYRQERFESAAERLARAERGASDEVGRSVSALLYDCSAALLDSGKPRRALAAVTPLIEGSQAGAKEYALAGDIHLALREYHRAHARYQQALNLDPDHREAALKRTSAAEGAVDELIFRARALLSAGDIAEALKATENALAIFPLESTALSLREEVRARMKRRAAEFFDSAAAILSAGDPHRALELNRKGRTLSPEDPRGMKLEESILTGLTAEMEQAIEEGRTLLAENRLAEAERAFERVLKLDPGHPAASQGRERIAALRRERALEATAQGDRALEEGRLPEARTAFEKALQLQPELDAARAGLARASALLVTMIDEEVQWGRRAKTGGDMLQARRHFNKALNFRPDAEVRSELAAVDRALEEKIEILLAAAESALDCGDFRRARGFFEQVLECASENSEAIDGLTAVKTGATAEVRRLMATAGSHLAAGRFDQALEGYRRILAIEPADDGARNGVRQCRDQMRGELAAIISDGTETLKAGRFAAAEKSFRQALALDPFQPEALQGLAQIEQLKVIGDEPGDAQQLYLRGIELYARGRYEDAVTTWERVLHLAPKYQKAVTGIERARRKLRRIQT